MSNWRPAGRMRSHCLYIATRGYYYYYISKTVARSQFFCEEFEFDMPAVADVTYI
jgi:hypothetical protein